MKAQLAILAAATGLLLALGGSAQSADACYEVIPARAKIEPPAPMLVDKCSGRTWLLVRAGRAYRWAAVAADEEKPKATDRPVVDAQPARTDKDAQKCFTFNNRKFCE
jgi:hypothetical protein